MRSATGVDRPSVDGSKKIELPKSKNVNFRSVSQIWRPKASALAPDVDGTSEGVGDLLPLAIFNARQSPQWQKVPDPVRLRLQSLAGGELVAAEEFGGWHDAFAGGLEGEDLEGAVAGGDEESLGAGVEDCAGVNIGVRGGTHYCGAVNNQT